MARAVIRPKARRDVTGILAQYFETAGDEIAKRFRAAAVDTFRELAESPFMVVVRKVRRPEFHGVRMWRVRGFESYLIFYKPRKDGVVIERVIHASRDYQRVLE